MKEYINRIIHADCSTFMENIPENAIDCIITSPPYDDLRIYDGYQFNFEKIASELFRILKKGGVLVWVIRDSVKDGDRSLTSFKHALHFQSLGFKVYDVIIFKKKSPSLPHTNRYLDCFEYMFVLSKESKPNTVNLIYDRKNKNYGSYTRSSNYIREKDGSKSKRRKRWIKKYSRRYNIWKYIVGHNNTTSDQIAFNHPAVFPDNLAMDHIYSWSNIGDIVLDPMCGSGTTCKAAYIMQRKYIGIEISETYCNIAKERLRDHYNHQLTESEIEHIYNKKSEYEHIKTINDFFH